jgi:transcriptional regulator with XRE-family HTH domain
MDPSTLLGRRMRARRSELGRTLLTVANEAGLSVPYVANLEKGRGNPTLDVVVSLARALEVDPAELLQADDTQSGHVDQALVDLDAVLVDYAQGKVFQSETEWLARACGIPVDEMRMQLLRVMAQSPKARGSHLSKRDCGRLLDAYSLILTDSGNDRK